MKEKEIIIIEEKEKNDFFKIAFKLSLQIFFVHLYILLIGHVIIVGGGLPLWIIIASLSSSFIMGFFIAVDSCTIKKVKVEKKVKIKEVTK